MHIVEGVSGAPVLCRDSEDGYWVKAIHQRDASAIIHNTRAALKLSRPMLENIQNNMGASVLVYHYDLSNPQITSGSQKITANDLLQIIAVINEKEKSSNELHRLSVDLCSN